MEKGRIKGKKNRGKEKEGMKEESGRKGRRERWER